ncbi:MAG: hypothetical protein ABW168_08260 [Sedimenticola sp.]
MGPGELGVASYLLVTEDAYGSIRKPGSCKVILGDEVIQASCANAYAFIQKDMSLSSYPSLQVQYSNPEDLATPINRQVTDSSAGLAFLLAKISYFIKSGLYSAAEDLPPRIAAFGEINCEGKLTAVDVGTLPRKLDAACQVLESGDWLMLPAGQNGARDKLECLRERGVQIHVVAHSQDVIKLISLSTRKPSSFCSRRCLLASAVVLGALSLSFLVWFVIEQPIQVPHDESPAQGDPTVKTSLMGEQSPEPYQLGDALVTSSKLQPGERPSTLAPEAFDFSVCFEKSLGVGLSAGLHRLLERMSNQHVTDGSGCNFYNMVKSVDLGDMAEKLEFEAGGMVDYRIDWARRRIFLKRI